MAHQIVAELMVAPMRRGHRRHEQRDQPGSGSTGRSSAPSTQRTGALTLLSLLTLFVAGVAFCLFMPRANRNARAFGSLMSNTPGWAAGWFFVPVAGLWKPYYAMKEIWQGSNPDPTVHAIGAGSGPAGPLWWWMFLICSFSGWIVAQSTKAVHGPST